MDLEEHDYSKRRRTNFVYNGLVGQIVPMDTTHVTVHKSVSIISDGAFLSCSQLVEVEFPSSIGLQTIGSNSFSKCTSLLRVTIPVTVFSIGMRAFDRCTALAEVQFAKVGLLKNIGCFAFHGCTALARLALPSSLVKISEHCFQECESLISVEMQNGIQSIEESAFADCSGLTHVSIPSTVLYINYSAFARCTALSDIEFSNGLTELKQGVFQNCTSLTLVTLPSTLQGLSGFERCTGLTDIELKEGIISISTAAFLKCENLATIYIPSTVEGISERAFWHCLALLEVVLPEGLRLVGRQAFLGCRSLERVSLPSTLETITRGLFHGCSSLANVYFSAEGLKRIESQAFEQCTSLTAIALPKSVEWIGDRAFLGCTSLLGVQLSHANSRQQQLVVERLAFGGCHSLVNICVPDNSSGPLLRVDNVFAGCTALGNNSSDDDIILWDSNDWVTLQQRFADLPVHNACYQSSHFQIDDLVATVHSCTQTDLVDKFGMTPFHILATCANLSTKLVEALMNKYPLGVVHQTDSQGNSMLDYLIKNQASNASPLIQLGLQRTVIDEMNDWGLGSYRSSFGTLVESTSFNSMNAETTRLQVWEEVKYTFSSHVKTEMALILELAVWKRNIRVLSADRAGCRVIGGADVIPSNVSAFLWDDSTRIGFNFEDI